MAMVLGAIGVAMAMHAHLEQRMDTLAILKAMGADSIDLLRIFVLQTLGLGLAGALLGVAAGMGVMAALPSAFGSCCRCTPCLKFPWQSGAGRPGHGRTHHLAVLFAAIDGGAQRKARAGVAPAGGAGYWRHRRMLSALASALAATASVRRAGCAAGRDCVGTVGFRSCGRELWRGVCCCAGGVAGAGCNHAAWIAAVLDDHAVAAAGLCCAMGWQIFTGPETSRRRCWLRWERA